MLPKIVLLFLAIGSRAMAIPHTDPAPAPSPLIARAPPRNGTTTETLYIYEAVRHNEPVLGLFVSPAKLPVSNVTGCPSLAVLASSQRVPDVAKPWALVEGHIDKPDMMIVNADGIGLLVIVASPTGWDVLGTHVGVGNVHGGRCRAASTAAEKTPATCWAPGRHVSAIELFECEVIADH